MSVSRQEFGALVDGVVSSLLPYTTNEGCEALFFSSRRPELQSAPVTALLSLPRAGKRERLDEPRDATTDMKKIAAVAVASLAADAGSAGRSANAQRDAKDLAEDTRVQALDAASTGPGPAWFLSDDLFGFSFP